MFGACDFLLLLGLRALCFKFACLVVWIVLGRRLFDCFDCKCWLFGLVVVYDCVVLFWYCWVACVLIVLLCLFLNLWFCFVIM